MMSLSVQAAVSQLQRQAFDAHDVYELDRIDRALDELVRNPEKTAPPAFQSRSAMANASKILQGRKRVATFVPIDQQIKSDGKTCEIELASPDCQRDVVDTFLWLETTPRLNAQQRAILWALATGDDARSLADRYGIPVARMRERISRARDVGWVAFNTEMRSG